MNEFNAYFVNIAKNLADSIPVADRFSTYLNDPPDNTLNFDLVTEQGVAYVIHNLKNRKVMVMIIYPIFYNKKNQATLVKPLTFLILNRRSPKKTIRLITSTYFAHTTPLFEEEKLLKVQDIFKLRLLKFYYKLCFACCLHISIDIVKLLKWNLLVYCVNMSYTNQ